MIEAILRSALPRLSRGPRLHTAAWVALSVAFVAGLPARADGPGVALGETARLHAFLELESRYDSFAGQGGIGNVTNPATDPACDHSGDRD